MHSFTSQMWSRSGWNAPLRLTASITSRGPRCASSHLEQMISKSLHIRVWILFLPPTPLHLNNQWLHFAVISIKPFPTLAAARAPARLQRHGSSAAWKTCSTNPATCWSHGSICSPAAPCNLFASVLAEGGDESQGEGCRNTFNFPTSAAWQRHSHTSTQDWGERKDQGPLIFLS